MFEQFQPFEFHNNAALLVKASLGDKPQVRTILFDGQNIGRTFNEYFTYMKDKAGRTKSTELKSIVENLQGTDDAREKTLQDFLRRRLALYFGAFQDKAKLRKDADHYSDKVKEPINKLYDNVYFTVAFQAAVVCGFFLVREKAEQARKERDAVLESREDTFKEYIDALNGFFVPTTVGKLKNLLRSFFYEVKGDRAEEWVIAPTAQTFKAVVYGNEMKPDEWPKYRLPLLEVWRPTDPLVKEVRNKQLERCREQVFGGLYSRQRQEYCRNQRKNEEELRKPDKDEIFRVAFDNFDAFLTNLGVSRQEDRLLRDKAEEIVKAFEGPEPVETVTPI